MRYLIFVLVVFLPSAASAQTSPCDGGTPNPRFTVVGNPVRLTFEHLTLHRVLAPQVTIAGTSITVVQFLDDIPPPPGGPVASCNSQTVSLGVLPPGTYTVTWSYVLPPAIPGGQPQPVESYTFAFAITAAVPALQGPVLLALMLLLGSLGVVMVLRA